jgi:Na+-transporting methylmalonyl-CoA/oxaloacetate decarboxylase gamma subunit
MYVSGYARKPEPKWPYFALTAIVILVLILLMLIVSFVGSCFESVTEFAKTAPATSAIKRAAAVTATTRLVNKNTGAVVSKMSVTIEAERVYCYTTIIVPVVPTEIRHVWLNPKGEEHNSVSLTISRQPANTWSYINLAGKMTGRWQVQVRSADEKLLGEASFTLD